MECFGVPGLMPDWSIQTKESEDFISCAGVLSKGRTRGRTWGVRETCSQRLQGKSYQEFIFACDSVGSFLGHAFGVGLVSA